MQNMTKNLSKNEKTLIIECLKDLLSIFNNNTIKEFSAARKDLETKTKSYNLSYSNLFDYFSFMNNKPEDDRHQKMQNICTELLTLNLPTAHLDAGKRYTGDILMARAFSALHCNSSGDKHRALFKEIQALIRVQINTINNQLIEEDKKSPPLYEDKQTTLQRIRWEVMAATILGALSSTLGSAMLYAPYLLLPYVLPQVISAALVVVGALSLVYGLYLGFALCFDEDMVYNKRKKPIINDQADTTEYATSNNRAWFCCC